MLHSEVEGAAPGNAKTRRRPATARLLRTLHAGWPSFDGRRERVIAAYLVAASVIATALALEVTLRLSGYRAAHERAAARLIDDPRTTLLDCYPSNPRRYFDIDLRTPRERERYRRMVARRRFEAVSERAPYAVESRYNSLGFRDAPLSPRVAGTRRALLIGDSFTEGQGVKERDTYARVLERSLNASPIDRWEVRNCGRRGADFPGLYQTFSNVIPYGADVVVYAMVLNDAVQSPSFAARQDHLNEWMMFRGRLTANEEDDRSSWLDSRLWMFVRQRWEDRHVSRASIRCYRDMYADANRDGWQATQDLIRAMESGTRAQGGRFLLALWPWLVDLQRNYPFEDAHETIRRFCQDAGIPFVDLRGSLRAHPAESLRVHPVDWHPNETAHQIAGETLAPVIHEMGTIDALRWTSSRSEGHRSAVPNVASNK